MSNTYYLNANDFGREGSSLVANIGGLTFVMFHSQRCSHCVNFLPEFKQLPGSIRGINFGVCSVDGANQQVTAMARDSSTPITAVPKFILYNDGMPYVEYSGARSRQAVINFLQEIVTKLDQKQSFTRPRRSRANEQPMMEQPQQYVPQSLQPGGGAVGGSGGPTRPSGLMGGGNGGPAQGGGNANVSYKITPNTGVKEYETSYGRPYNTLNESDFLEYENAYKQQMQGAK